MCFKGHDSDYGLFQRLNELIEMKQSAEIGRTSICVGQFCITVTNTIFKERKVLFGLWLLKVPVCQLMTPYFRDFSMTLK